MRALAVVVVVVALACVVEVAALEVAANCTQFQTRATCNATAGCAWCGHDATTDWCNACYSTAVDQCCPHAACPALCAIDTVCGFFECGPTCCAQGATVCASYGCDYFCCDSGSSCCGGEETDHPVCCPDSQACCYAWIHPTCFDPKTEICCSDNQNAWTCPAGSACVQSFSCTTLCTAHPGMIFLDGREALTPYSQPNEAACCQSCQVEVTGAGKPLVGATFDLVTRTCTCWQSGTLHPIPDHREFVVALVPQPQGDNKHAQMHKHDDRARPLQ